MAIYRQVYRQVAFLLLVFFPFLKSDGIIDTNKGIVDGQIFVREMSTDAQQTLFDLRDMMGIHTYKGLPVPIYRDDLPSDYIAYWQVEVDDGFVVISAGSRTGDRQLIHRGPLPTFSVVVDADAGHRGRSCSRFYLLSPGGEMMCRDHDGFVVGSNIPDYIIGEQSITARTVGYADVLNDFIRSKLPGLKRQWEQHRGTVTDTHNGGIHEGGDELRQEESTEHAEEFNVSPLRPGKAVDIAIGDIHKVEEITVRYIPTEDDTSNGRDVQRVLCSVVKGCFNGTINKMAADIIRTDAGTERAVLSLKLLLPAERVFRRKSIVFVLGIRGPDGGISERYFGIIYGSHRGKRALEYTNWSCTTRSIPHESYFPHYDQFQSGDCAVGCGPVAWAMIFGYFDRRAHYENSSAYSGSTDLYCDGPDGTTGNSSEIAPKYVNSQRIHDYIEVLNDVLGTFCFTDGGLTLMGHMHRAEPFFQDRQQSGSPHLAEKRWLLTGLGLYDDSITSWVRARIDEGWPVIIGWKTDWLTGWHYPVVTKYETCSREKRRCYYFWGKSHCGSWDTEVEYKMYLHQGWGSYEDGWKTMEAFYATVAKY